MARVSGRWVSLSTNRRMITELMSACRGMPIISIERTMALGDVVAAREALPEPPPWVALFAKAYAIVAERRPELRRSYLPFPWPHFYEADETICSIAIERNDEPGATRFVAGLCEAGLAEPAIYFGLFRSPNRQPIAQLQHAIREWLAKPVEEVSEFRQMLQFMRVPRPLRKLLWWYAVKASGRMRTKHFGTLGISTTAAAGATCLNLIAPTTATLNCGLFQPDGTLAVRLHFDHRVFDGMPAALALLEMERALTGSILSELRTMAGTSNRIGVRNVDVVVR